MPTINLEGFDTQSAPMKAITEVVKDYFECSVSSREAMNYIFAICEEWNH